MRLWRLLAFTVITWSAFLHTAAAGLSSIHVTAYDVRLTVDPNGLTNVQHVLSFRVGGVAVRDLELSGVEQNATLDPVVQLAGENADRIPTHVTLNDGTVGIDVDSPKGLRHGGYVLRFRYRVDLSTAGELDRQGAMWKIAWRSPVLAEGFDGARVVFDLPAAGTEPRPLDVTSGVLFMLRRSPERDELELVRPHVAAGEAALWEILIDPRALSALRVRSQKNAAPSPPEFRESHGFAWVAIALCGFAFAALVLKKAREVERSALKAAATIPSVVPLPAPIRALLAGGGFAAGIAWQLSEQPTPGALLLAFAMLLSAYRVPAVARRVRGPGRWLVLRPDDVFSKTRLTGCWLDLTCRVGAVVFVLGGASILLIAFAAGHSNQALRYFMLLDALVFLPIFATATGVESLANPAMSSIPKLRALFKGMARLSSLRIAVKGRFPVASTCNEPDEVRLLAIPKLGMPGLLGIEVGVASHAEAGAYAAQPEVLVRVEEASAAAARMTKLVPHIVAIPGRRPEERVVPLSPRLPTRRATLRLVERLANELRDRRLVIASWKGEERRIVPNARTGAVVSL